VKVIVSEIRSYEPGAWRGRRQCPIVEIFERTANRASTGMPRSQTTDTAKISPLHRFEANYHLIARDTAICVVVWQAFAFRVGLTASIERLPKQCKEACGETPTRNVSSFHLCVISQSFPGDR
jgi:hypothetical protein